MGIHSQRVLDFLARFGVTSAKFVRDTETTDNAIAIKTLVFSTSCLEKPHVVVIIPACKRVNVASLQSLLKCSYVSLASPAAAEVLTGFSIGCIAPFAYPSALPTYLADDILHYDQVQCGIGEIGYHLCISSQDLVHCTAAVVASLQGGASCCSDNEPIPDAETGTPTPLYEAHPTEQHSSTFPPLDITSNSQFGDERINPKTEYSNAYRQASEQGVDVTRPLMSTQLDAEVLRSRRIGKALLFATVLAPDSVLQRVSEAAGVEVTELQVVAGRSLQEAVGSDQITTLLKQVRPGCVIRVQGLVYANPRPDTVDLKLRLLEIISAAPDAPPVSRRSPMQQSYRLERDSKNKRFHDFPLTLGNVKIVDDADSLRTFHQVVLQLRLSQGVEGSCALVGVDMEWQPVRNKSTQAQVSIVQIATREIVFLIDVQTLKSSSNDTLLTDDNASDQSNRDSRAEGTCWFDLLMHLFSNVSINKLGFGLRHDLKVLSRIHPDLAELESQACNCTDIREVAGGGKIGLSALVKQILGASLDKAEQCSDWSRRPLTKSQILYAANDAHCLLELYDKLRCGLGGHPVHEESCELARLPLQVPFLATFANGRTVAATRLSSSGAQLFWANGIVYRRPDAVVASPSDLLGQWLDRGMSLEISYMDAKGCFIVSGPDTGWFPAVIH